MCAGAEEYGPDVQAGIDVVRGNKFRIECYGALDAVKEVGGGRSRYRHVGRGVRESGCVGRGAKDINFSRWRAISCIQSIYQDDSCINGQ